MHSLNAHLVELSKSLVVLVLLNSQQISFLCALLALAQCPPDRASQNSYELLSTTVSFIDSLTSKVFNNLQVFLELMISASVPQHIFV
jgi:hypothetical protein